MQDTFYVYGLIDSRNNELFYVGKGKNKRAKYHIYARKSDCLNPRKDKRVNEIIDSGSKIDIVYFKTDMSELDALKLEATTIKELGRKHIDPNGVLLNISEGGTQPPNIKGRKRKSETVEKIRAWNAAKVDNGWTQSPAFYEAMKNRPYKQPWNKGIICKGSLDQLKRGKLRSLTTKLWKEQRFDELLRLEMSDRTRRSWKRRIINYKEDNRL